MALKGQMEDGVEASRGHDDPRRGISASSVRPGLRRESSPNDCYYHFIVTVLRKAGSQEMLLAVTDKETNSQV